jgi:hypothetical protein
LISVELTLSNDVVDVDDSAAVRGDYGCLVMGARTSSVMSNAQVALSYIRHSGTEYLAHELLSMTWQPS